MATNSYGSATASSVATSVVASPPPPPPPPPPSGLGSGLSARMPESSGAKTLVVSPAGSGTSCTVSTPCAFNEAWALAASGTVIQLRGNAGTYAGNLMIMNRDYSSTNPVTLTTYPGDPQATFVGTTTHPQEVFDFAGDSGIRIRNVSLAPPWNSGFKIEESQHVELDHVLVHNSGSSCPSTAIFTQCGGGGVLVSGGDPTYSPSYSADVQIWNSVFVNNGGTSTDATVGCCNSSSRHDHALYLGAGGAPTNTTEGGFRSMVVANNLIYDSRPGYPVQIGGEGRNLIFTNNTIYNTSNADVGCGIVFWAEGNWPDQNNLIVNNIVSTIPTSGASSTGAVCSVTAKSGLTNYVRNNLAYGVPSPAYDPRWGSTNPITFFCGTSSSDSCPGKNQPNADPLFVNGGGTYGSMSKDFHLQSGSPALGKGDPAYTPPTDASGAARALYPNGSGGTGPALGAFG
jgi:hypothetical protein